MFQVALVRPVPLPERVMDCVPTRAVTLEMVSIWEGQSMPDIKYVALLFCADASCGKNETPEAKTSTKNKARAGNPGKPERALY